jgi:hypothetical protein
MCCRLALVVIVSGILIAVAFGYIGITTALEAERTLHAHNVALDVIATYVETTNEWPTDWDRLEKVTPRAKHGIWTWPSDRGDIESSVHVDFEALPLHRIEEGLDVVMPFGPSYPPSKALVDRLSRVILVKQQHERREDEN